MPNSKNDIWVGLFVLISILAFIFLAFKSANLGSVNFNSKTYNVWAYFDNIGGLKPQAAIKSSGVIVGRVKKISFDNETFQAKVDLTLNKNIEFPKDSSIKILTGGLLGEQYIGIEAGADEENLIEGDRILATQSAVVLENLISQFLYNKALDKD